MEWLAHMLRAQPVIPIFLTIGMGFWLGNLKYKSFTLGPVAATLLVGVLIGQLQIPVPEIVRTIFFMLFLFSIGYSVGPQFFQSFKGHGLKQVCFALMEAVICAFTVIAGAWQRRNHLQPVRSSHGGAGNGKRLAIGNDSL